MRNAAAMLYCPNPTCQAANSEDHKFCQKCSTPLPRRYLWALSQGSSAYQSGDLVAERYLCKQSRVFLDTKPGLLSSTYQELPERLLPYLRLVPCQLHTPQIYDWLPGTNASTAGLVLLDHVPFCGSEYSAAPETQLQPTLASQWQHASALRQLNWLWQVANLWLPFSAEKVAASLLDPELLRVEGSLLRLLELQLDAGQRTLSDLGQFWLPWVKTAQPEIAGFLHKLCQGLIQSQIHNAELLVGYLDGALAQVSQSQTRQIQIATLSDQGPTRQRNEDACYPASGARSGPVADNALLIVCDGIGGHQGGDVASHLAITTLEQQVKALNVAQFDSVGLSIALEKAVCVANDEISQRNNSENRFDRQRMGTTVVMALARDHELYVTHVGDSRAYWITRRGCHQITLDDDVASREVRLGYSFYRQAMHQPSAGSLVQALGMGTSTMLYPTVQRFILDEDCIFLLCSDGLSDNDRVEESWEHEILPLLDGKTDLATISQKLVEIANTRNGYDNVTVGLIHYRVALSQPVPMVTGLPTIQFLEATQPDFSYAADEDTQQTELVAPTMPSAPLPSSFPATEPTEIISAPPKANVLPFLLGIGILAGMGVVLIAMLLPSFQLDRSVSDSGPMPSTSASPGTDPQAADSLTRPTSLEVGALIQLSGSISDGNPVKLPVLISGPEPGRSPAPPSPPPSATSPSLSAPSLSPNSTSPNSTSPNLAAETIGFVPVGTVLEVLRKQSLSQQESWVELRVCSTAAGDSPEQPISPSVAEPSALEASPPRPLPANPAVAVVQPGQTGWIREAEILPQVVPANLSSTPSQTCQAVKKSSNAG